MTASIRYLGLIVYFLTVVAGLSAGAGGGNEDGPPPAGVETPAPGGAGATPAPSGTGDTPAPGGTGGTPATGGTGGTPAPTGSSSETLIDQALAKGEINAETALIYRVLATFGDTRLPAAYKGDDSGVFETTALNEALAQFDSLSSAAQNTLTPFLLRPASIGSWADPSLSRSAIPAAIPSKARMVPMAADGGVNFRPACKGELGGWLFVSGAHAKIWYQSDIAGQKEKAVTVANAIEQAIWPNLIGGMKFNPPLDDNIFFTECDGGDPHLDVYLVSNVNFRGLAVSLGGTLHQAPVFIMLNTAQLTDDKQLSGGMAHEFMHAIQWAYEMKSTHESYGWLLDAMANWAIDHVYGKTIQVEQDYADCFTSTPSFSLDDRRKVSCGHWSNNIERDYGAYLFFQFIARTAGADKVKLALENTQTMATSLEAVDAAITGGFKEQWWKFAKTLWNQAPIDTQSNSFKQWDDLKETPKQRDIDGDLHGAPEALYDDFYIDQDNLSSRYYHFTFSDPNTRSILFYNGFFDQIKAGKAIRILAIWQDAAGAWQEEDWTNYKFVGLCRDLKSQRVKDLTIIVANGEKEHGGKVTATNAPHLLRNNVGCYKYEGQVTMIHKDKGWGGMGRKAVLNIAFGFFDPAKLQGMNVSNPGIPNSLRAGLNLVTNNIGTEYSFEVDYTDGGCKYTYGPATRSLAWGTVAGALMLNTFPELDGTKDVQYILDLPDRGYLGELIDSNPISINVTGQSTGQSCASPKMGIPGLLFSSGTDRVKTSVVMQDGTMQGSFTAANTTWTWMLEPKSEP